MNIETLQKIYPGATLHPFATDDSAYFVFSSQHKFLWIPKNELSPTEFQLLQTLSTPSKQGQQMKEHPWFKALFEHQKPPVDTGTYRIIQVEFNHLDSTTIENWNSELQSILPQLVDYFFVTENYALLVEVYHEEALMIDDLEGVFLALDGDFNLYTKIFVGSFYAHTEDFTRLLHEEEALFQYELTHSIEKKAYTLASASVAFFSSEVVKDSYLMRTLYHQWFLEADLIEIITNLWKNQGNVSSTAKDLFMHRNTLQYKLDKFQLLTHCNLKKMDDLFLCYLLTLTFK